MKQIQSINNPSIIEQFKKYPNQGILFEIIENGITGTILEFNENLFVVKENCDDPFVFIVGELTEKSVSQITELLKGSHFPMVHCNKRFHPLFLEKGWSFHIRTSLKLNAHKNIIIMMIFC